MRAPSVGIILVAGLLVLVAQLVVWLTPIRNFIVETDTRAVPGLSDTASVEAPAEDAAQSAALSDRNITANVDQVDSEEAPAAAEDTTAQAPAVREPGADITVRPPEAMAPPGPPEPEYDGSGQDTLDEAPSAADVAVAQGPTEPGEADAEGAPSAAEETTAQASSVTEAEGPDRSSQEADEDMAPVSPSDEAREADVEGALSAAEGAPAAAAETQGPSVTEAPDRSSQAADETTADASADAGQTAVEDATIAADEPMAPIPEPAAEVNASEPITEPAAPEKVFLVDAIRRKLTDSVLRKGVHPDDLAALETFYAAYDGPARWVTSAGLTPQAQTIVTEIAKAEDWGLDPKAFQVPPPDFQPTTNEDQAAVEVAIDVAILKYARAAQGGLPEPSQVSSVFAQDPSLREPATVLTEILAASEPDSYLKTLHPQHPQFERLRQALLKARATGEAPPEDLKRLRVNMDRWRWMPADLGTRYVWLNIPEFALRVMKDGTEIHSEKAVVGSSATPTPVLSADLKSIEFHPYRVVPLSIIRRTVLPALQKSRGGLFGGGGSSVLNQYQLEVRQKGKPIDPDDIDWEKTSLRDFTFVQAPGPTNTLGKVQFLFPNPRGIDLHETIVPARLQGAERAQGEPSPRIGDPEKLSAVLLSEDKGWGSAKIAKLIADEKNTTVRLKNPIPVHLTYFTAWVDEEGQVETFVDIYGLDGQADGKKNEQDDNASGAPPTTGSTPPPSRKPVEG